MTNASTRSKPAPVSNSLSGFGTVTLSNFTLSRHHDATSAKPSAPYEGIVRGCEHGTVVIVPSDHGKSRAGTLTTSRVITRLGLLDDLIEAGRSADRNRADALWFGGEVVSGPLRPKIIFA